MPFEFITFFFFLAIRTKSEKTKNHLLLIKKKVSLCIIKKKNFFKGATITLIGSQVIARKFGINYSTEILKKSYREKRIKILKKKDKLKKLVLLPHN